MNRSAVCKKCGTTFTYDPWVDDHDVCRNCLHADEIDDVAVVTIDDAGQDARATSSRQPHANYGGDQDLMIESIKQDSSAAATDFTTDLERTPEHGTADYDAATTDDDDDDSEQKSWKFIFRVIPLKNKWMQYISFVFVIFIFLANFILRTVWNAILNPKQNIKTIIAAIILLLIVVFVDFDDDATNLPGPSAPRIASQPSKNPRDDDATNLLGPSAPRIASQPSKKPRNDSFNNTQREVVTTAQLDSILERATEITGRQFTSRGLGSIELGMTMRDIQNEGYEIDNPDVFSVFHVASRNVGNKIEEYGIHFDKNNCVDVIEEVVPYDRISPELFTDSFGPFSEKNLFKRTASLFSARYFFPETAVTIGTSINHRGSISAVVGVRDREKYRENLRQELKIFSELLKYGYTAFQAHIAGKKIRDIPDSSDIRVSMASNYPDAWEIRMKNVVDGVGGDDPLMRVYETDDGVTILKCHPFISTITRVSVPFQYEVFRDLLLQFLPPDSGKYTIETNSKRRGYKWNSRGLSVEIITYSETEYDWQIPLSWMFWIETQGEPRWK